MMTLDVECMLNERAFYRLSAGQRSVQLMSDFLKDRAKAEDSISRVYTKLNDKWTKKMIEMPEDECPVLKNFLVKFITTEPLEVAKIHSKVAQDLQAKPGPLVKLQNYIQDMNSSEKDVEIIRRYAKAVENKQTTFDKIHKAMQKYHRKMRKFEKLHNDVAQFPSSSADLNKSGDLETRQTESNRDDSETRKQQAERDLMAAKKQYSSRLRQSRGDQEMFVREMLEVKNHLDMCERERLTLVKEIQQDTIKHLRQLNRSRPQHDAHIDDLNNLLEQMDVDAQIAQWDTAHTEEISFPTFEAYHSEAGGTGDSTAPAARDTDSPSIQNGQQRRRRHRKLTRKHGAPDEPGSQSSQRPSTCTPDVLSRGIDANYFPAINEPMMDLRRHHGLVEKGDAVRTVIGSDSLCSQCADPVNSFSSTALDKERAHSISSRGSKRENETQNDPDANVSVRSNVHVVANKAYTGCAENELSFDEGQCLKQTTPANAAGLAYGWMRYHPFCKRQYGFYPATHVTLQPK